MVAAATTLPDRMPTEQEQIAALQAVRRALWTQYRLALPIVLDLGDVAFLHVSQAGHQIVHATATYDGWDRDTRDGQPRLCRPDMTLEEAVTWAKRHTDRTVRR